MYYSYRTIGIALKDITVPWSPCLTMYFLPFVPFPSAWLLNGGEKGSLQDPLSSNYTFLYVVSVSPVLLAVTHVVTAPKSVSLVPV